MKKGNGPRRNAAKTRAWLDRSRQKARTQEEAVIAASRKVADRPVSKLDRVEFRPAQSASLYPCDRCQRLSRDAIAEGARGRDIPEVHRADHWHHWLEQQHLKTYVRGLRVSDDEAARELKRLIHDERNLSPVCVGCHGNTGLTHARAFTFEDVPPAAFAFAGELGPEWLERLRRKYTRNAP